MTILYVILNLVPFFSFFPIFFSFPLTLFLILEIFLYGSHVCVSVYVAEAAGSGV